MKRFNSIKEICDAINDMAINENYFDQDPSEIDEDANIFVERFAAKHGLEAHTVTPSRWWFAYPEKMFEDGEIELHPMVNHAIEELHPKDRLKQIRFMCVDVHKAKITDSD